ncbi:MAG: glycolate oxidase subunit GlcF [Chloroflexota bacterium]
MASQPNARGHRHEAGARVTPAFDAHHAPSLNLIDECVHCGFCLPSCPTYVLWGEEMDSPRGRIYLMKEALEGEPMDAGWVRHIDRCLGCLACVTACPSGVQYGKLIESTRQQVERRYPRTLAERAFREMIFRLFPYPRRLRLVTAPLALYQHSGAQKVVRGSGLLGRLPPSVASLEALLPPIPAGGRPLPRRIAAMGTERRRVGMVLGCVQRVLFPHVNAATARVLSADGCVVMTPPRQGCCGALSQHAGREREAMNFARQTIDNFEGTDVDTVVINVAGCGSMLKEYGYLLRDDPIYADRAQRFSDKVRDVSELLCELGPAAERHPLRATAVYHDACHLAHGQGITSQPRRLLAQIPGLEMREVPRERDICCGSAGTYNLLQPEAGRALGERKARNVWEAQADILVTANPGCHLQIQANLRRMGKEMPASHVVELIDASIQGRDLDAVVRPT